LSYPVTPEVAALAQRIAGNETTAKAKASAIEQYLLRHYQYVMRPESIGHPMTVDDFLLREKRGHCEFFAAGMVALLSIEGVPARIVGGFYGGRLNPLTGYFLLRNEDAHAWVEAWDGTKWETFDPTPPSMRPGNTQGGLWSTYLAAIGDSVTYFWDRYILTYGLGDQITLAANLIAQARAWLDSMRVSIRLRGRLHAIDYLGIAGAIAFAAMVLFAFTRRRTTLFDILAAHLRRLGIEVGPAMTMEEALDVLRAQHPARARELEPLIAMYEAERFSSHRDAKRAPAIRRRIAELRAIS